MDSRTEMFRYFYPWRPFFVCVSVVSKGEFISLRDWRLANCVHVVWTLCKSCVIVWPVAAGIPTGGVRFLFCRNGDDIILFRCSREKSRIPCLICLPCLQKKERLSTIKNEKKFIWWFQLSNIHLDLSGSLPCFSWNSKRGHMITGHTCVSLLFLFANDAKCKTNSFLFLIFFFFIFQVNRVRSECWLRKNCEHAVFSFLSRPSGIKFFLCFTCEREKTKKKMTRNARVRVDVTRQRDPTLGSCTEPAWWSPRTAIVR